jgi:MoxR-vWA-beta-propeller ternary system domain bpX4
MLIRFLEGLEEGGSVPVADAEPVVDKECSAWLKGRFERLSLELAGPPLPFDADAAAWGAGRLYEACRYLTYRQEGPETVHKAFAGPAPKPTPAAIFGVDLVLRHLPELWTLAASLADDDPLIDELKRLAVSWPLSSVGTPGIEGTDPSPILVHRGLRQLYTDRILQKRDRSRLSDPRVRSAALEAIGEHSELRAFVEGR